MIVIGHEFPEYDSPSAMTDRSWPTARPSATATQPNAMLCVSSLSTHNAMHEVPMTIMCNRGGPAFYETPDDRYHLSTSDLLILNDGEKVAATVDSGIEVESFYVVFRRAYVQDILHVLQSSEAALLDDPKDGIKSSDKSSHSEEPLRILEKVRSIKGAIGTELLRLRCLVRNNPEASGITEEPILEEQFFALVEALISEERDFLRRVKQLPYARMSTKKELARRLLLAKDYMHAHISEEVTIEEMAHVAMLSPFHFLRTFRALIGVTPYQYHRRLRIAYASDLLLATDTTIAEVMYRTGFRSLGSFTTMFRQEMGSPPAKYRAANGPNRSMRMT